VHSLSVFLVVLCQHACSSDLSIVLDGLPQHALKNLKIREIPVKKSKKAEKNP
jgi:hypothetical protein